MLVPFPRAASRRLISFLTFQISMFFSASFACGADMAAVVLKACVRGCSAGRGGGCEFYTVEGYARAEGADGAATLSMGTLLCSAARRRSQSGRVVVRCVLCLGRRTRKSQPAGGD